MSFFECFRQISTEYVVADGLGRHGSGPCPGPESKQSTLGGLAPLVTGLAGRAGVHHGEGAGIHQAMQTGCIGSLPVVQACAWK